MPAFGPGDMLFLTNDLDGSVRVGEIIVFKLEDKEIPITHRVIKVHEK
jgi:signal peptidase